MMRLWVISLLLLNAPISYTEASEEGLDNQDRTVVEAKLQQITDDLIDLRKQHGVQSELLEELFAELQSLEQGIQNTRNQLDANQLDLDDANQQLKQLQQREQTIDGELNAQQEQLSEQFKAAYQLGRQSRLKLLLNMESATKVTRMLAYHERFSVQRAELITGIQSQMEALIDIRETILQQRTQIEQLDSQYADELLRLNEQQQQRRALAGDIRVELSGLESSIAELQLNQEQLETLLANLQDLFADIPDTLNEQDFSELRGQLDWPVTVSNPRLTTRYGQTRLQGMRWSGIFIEAAENQEVFAVARGRVAFADWLRGFGWLIIVDHNDGYMSLYGNNSQLLQEVGSWVSTGEQIAVSGSGFDAELRSGVYFELRHDGDAYDPEPWLAKR